MTLSASHRTRRAVLLSLLLILSIVGGVAFAGTTSAAVASSERSVEDETVQPGETVEVTIVTTLDESGERLQISDDFDPAFADTSITSVQYNGNSVLPIAVISQPDFIEVALEEDFQAGDTVTVTYEVTLPEDADPGDTFNSTGFSALDDSPPVNHTGVTTISINRPPTADAGSDQTVDEGISTTLTASESSDPDGDNLSYSWTQISGPDINLLGSDTETPNFTAPEVDTDTTLSFEVTVSDGNLTDTDVVNVTVEQVNAPPTADAGTDLTVDETTDVQLDASNSSDPDSDTLSYVWTQTSGPTVGLTDNDTVTPNFTAPEVDADTTLSFLVEVSDGNGGSDTDTTNVTVAQVNQPPTADAGDNQSVNESTTVTLSAAGSSDLDGDALNYSWTQTSGPSVELSDSETESPEFTAPTVSTATDLAFQLEISDGNGGSDTDAVTITVGAVNDPPSADAGPDQEVDEEAEVQLNASNTSDPDGDVVTYEWEQISGPSVTLSDDLIEAPSFAAPEVDTNTTLVFEVTTRDGNGGADTDAVNITVVAGNEPPVANAGSDQTVNATETALLDGTDSFDPEGGVLSYMWTQVAGPSVELSDPESATPTFVAPDMETTIEVVFELEVSDGDLTDTDSVTVTIEPSLAPANISVSDLSAPASVTQGDPVTVTANVTNTGDLEGTQTVDFRFDSDGSETLEENETLLNETVTLAGDENQSVEFEVPIDGIEPGTYLHGVVTENDTQTAQLNVTEAPLPANFSVSDLDAPSTVTQGENVTVTANVTNTGGLEGTQDVTFRLDANGDGTLKAGEILASETVTLTSGETTSIEFEVSTDGLATGTYLHGMVTANDSQTAQLSVAEPTPANFSVTTLSAPTSAVQGENVTVTVGVTNVGDQSGSQTVDLRVDDNQDGVLDADETVANRTIALGPGDSVEDTIKVSTDGFATGTFTYGVVTDNDTRTEEFTLVPPSTPANFSVTDLSAPESVTQGETVTVTANITNIGGQEGTQTVDFRLDDGSGTLAEGETLENQSVTLTSGESQPVEFEVSSGGLELGTYRHGVVTDDDMQTAQIDITDPTPTPEPSPGSDDDDDPPQFSSELTEQESGAVLEFSDATANRRYTIDLGDSIQSNDVTVSGTEMLFERSVNDGTIEFTADGSMPDGTQELAGAPVYISVETEDVSDEDLVEVEIEFTVPTSVLNEEDISPDNVQLYRFEDGQWVAYETSHQGDGEFIADEIPGFSMFAIGPAGAAEATSEQTPTATPTPEPTDTPTPEPTDTPTPEPTETSTPEPTETEVTEPTTTATVEQTTTSTQFPGFTPAVALIAMLIASLLVARFSRR